MAGLGYTYTVPSTTDNFLYHDYWRWTMSPSKYSYAGEFIGHGGSIGWPTVITSTDSANRTDTFIIPVINISNVTISQGDGSKTSPFVIN